MATRTATSSSTGDPQFFDLDLTNGTKHTWLGQDVTSETVFYLFSLCWLAIILAIVVRLRRSPMGLGFLLVGADRQAAAAVGMNPLRFRVYAFAVSGLLAGTGGILVELAVESTRRRSSTTSRPYSLVLLAIPVLAGLDSIAFVVVVAPRLPAGAGDAGVVADLARSSWPASA